MVFLTKTRVHLQASTAPREPSQLPHNAFDVIVKDAVRRGESADPSLVMDSINLVVLPQCSKGRVVLLGGAAHCLAVVSGQGAGMALPSAEALTQELCRVADVPQALISHEKRLQPGIERLQSRARELVFMMGT